MSNFSRLPEFDKEFHKLSKKYPSLTEDILKLEKVLTTSPIGFGTNFVTIHHSPNVKIVKTRLACKSMRDRSLRVIYAYQNIEVTFVYLEIYFKGDKENENHSRIENYLKYLEE